jgi:hypothetical protein
MRGKILRKPSRRWKRGRGGVFKCGFSRRLRQRGPVELEHQHHSSPSAPELPGDVMVFPGARPPAGRRAKSQARSPVEFGKRPHLPDVAHPFHHRHRRGWGSTGRGRRRFGHLARLQFIGSYRGHRSEISSCLTRKFQTSKTCVCATPGRGKPPPDLVTSPSPVRQSRANTSSARTVPSRSSSTNHRLLQNSFFLNGNLGVPCAACR